ncbi:hypothetical protein [Streptomyces sp. NPDC057325]|uniref:hypothetical protein n=1 Tax=unclassified Streptomyces TaxID=2593676 RepID=UPI00362A7E2E
MTTAPYGIGLTTSPPVFPPADTVTDRKDALHHLADASADSVPYADERARGTVSRE